MSLNKEEIHEFVLDNFYEFGDSRFDDETSDYVIRVLSKFLDSHHLNPIKSHDIRFFTRSNEEPWEISQYNITWEPEVALGVGMFEYVFVRIGIVPIEEKSGRPRSYIFKGEAGITVI